MNEREPLFGAAAILPEERRRALYALDPKALAGAEELRLRRGFPMTVLLGEGELEVGAGAVTEGELRGVVECASQASAHTVLDRVRQGFVTLRGGHRVGLCGTLARKDGQTATVRYLSSLAIRVARPIVGQAEGLLPRLREDGQFLSTLILAPPGAGKTTLLRDLVRGLSDGAAGPPCRVGLADERGEVAALWQGEPQLYVGRHTDVVDGCPKAEGLSILIRGMNPQVAAADEVTDPADARAMAEASGCGVALLATAHGAGPEDLRRRPVYRALLAAGVFRRLVVLERRGAARAARVEALP